ncbi:MAG: hypothetical protein RSE93_01170 [Oscillospiraceae bacterium]
MQIFAKQIKRLLNKEVSSNKTDIILSKPQVINNDIINKIENNYYTDIKKISDELEIQNRRYCSMLNISIENISF